MGELILCNQKLATLPYYIDEASLNIFSLEELNYYIENNLYLLEPNFVSEDLCTWIDKELQLHEVAVELREIYRRDGTLSEFVECILKQTGYFEPPQILKIVAVLKDMENKSEFECIKMRADRYAGNQRYVNAIYEYRKLLGMKDEQNEILLGNVWHNLGSAYAGLFLFHEAALCYKQAYELNENPESMRECLYAYRCMHDEQGFCTMATEFGVEEETLLEIKRSLNETSRMEDICRFEQQLEKLFAAGNEQEIGEIVTAWKDTYRKNNRI